MSNNSIVFKPKRRLFTADQKRQIVRETLAPGASVSSVARRHDVNTNQVFKWRRAYLRTQSEQAPGTLLPVIVTETIVPAPVLPPAPVRHAPEGTIELHLAHGRIVLTGKVDLDTLPLVVSLMR